MSETLARPDGTGSRPSDQTPSGSGASRFDPSCNGLRHYPRRAVKSGAMEIVDREFDFVRCVLPYDYRYTGNSQQWEEAAKICRALEGPMQALGVVAISPASATEARSAETGTGSVHEGAVGNAETPDPAHGLGPKG